MDLDLTKLAEFPADLKQIRIRVSGSAVLTPDAFCFKLAFSKDLHIVHSYQDIESFSLFDYMLLLPTGFRLKLKDGTTETYLSHKRKPLIEMLSAYVKQVD